MALKCQKIAKKVAKPLAMAEPTKMLLGNSYTLYEEKLNCHSLL